jgi:TetR/AcrR family transcriptional regulator
MIVTKSEAFHGVRAVETKEAGSMSNKKQFHKDVFERISDEKRNKIFATAIAEFATQGYGVANINTIAAKAGVSVGSLYTYFNSKEDLFLAVAEVGVQIFQEILADIKSKESSFIDTVRRLFFLTIRYAKEHDNLCRIYLDLTTEQMRSISERLLHKMEIDFCEFYIDLIEHAKERGEIPAYVDSPFLAMYLDNIVMALQLAFSTTYYKLRMIQYLGEDDSADEEKIVEKLVDLVRGSTGDITSGRANG